MDEQQTFLKGGANRTLGVLARIYVTAVTAFAGATTAVIGVWCLVDPVSFAKVVQFGVHQHFLHDLGAFQLGLGVTMLLALVWADALTTVLAGFFVVNTVHTVNHFVDLDQGGSMAQMWLLGAMSVQLALAFALRLRQQKTSAPAHAVKVRTHSARGADSTAHTRPDPGPGS